MFPQLDDPRPFSPSPDFRAAVRARGRQLKRRRRAARVGALGALPLIGLGVAGLELRDRVDAVQHVHVSTAGPVGPDPLKTGQAVTFLVIGTDAEAGAPYRAATTAAGRPDSIVLLRWTPADRTLHPLTLPRDLDLGFGKLDTRTVSQLPGDFEVALGIRVDHLIAIDMAGFAQLAGIVRPRVQVDQALRDRSAGLSLQPGCQALSGDQALAYVRSRHLQYRVASGKWADDTTGDFGRTARLTSLAVAVLSRLHDIGIDDWNDALGVLDDHAVLDDRLSVREFADWVRTLGGASGPLTIASGPLPLRLAPPTPHQSSALHIDPANAAQASAALASFGGHVGPSVPTEAEPGSAEEVNPVGRPIGALDAPC